MHWTSAASCKLPERREHRRQLSKGRQEDPRAVLVVLGILSRGNGDAPARRNLRGTFFVLEAKFLPERPRGHRRGRGGQGFGRVQKVRRVPQEARDQAGVLLQAQGTAGAADLAVAKVEAVFR